MDGWVDGLLTAIKNSHHNYLGPRAALKNRVCANRLKLTNLKTSNHILQNTNRKGVSLI